MSDENLQDIVRSVAKENSSDKKKIEELVQVVVFELDNEEYALKITDLREIIKIPEITSIPNSPEFIQGIFNLRGKIVVVVDLEKKFKFTRENKEKPKHIIITEVGGNDFGVIVDEVKEVLRIPVENIKPTPELISAKVHTEYLNGVIVFDNKENEKSRIIVMLDLVKLLEDKELLELGSTIKKTI
jgi:purine-binding chemotaxis protein CheW